MRGGNEVAHRTGSHKRQEQTGYGRIAQKVCASEAPDTRRTIRSKADRELFGVARVAQATSCCPMRSHVPRRSGSAAALAKSKRPVRRILERPTESAVAAKKKN